MVYFDLTSLNGSNGFVINGTQGNERVGQSVSSAGDFNGDGVDDLIVGSFASNSFEFTNPSTGNEENLSSFGRAYVIFGKPGGFAPSLDLSEITTDTEYQLGRSATLTQDYTKGFSIESLFGAESDGLVGFSVSSAGDIDKDGFDDLIIGAPGPSGGFNPNSPLPGEAWIVYGQKPNITETDPTPERDRAFNRDLRVTFLEGTAAKDRIGISVSSAGDVNKDGTPDVIIGARDAKGQAGQSYVVFGGADFIPGNTPDSSKTVFNLDALNGSNGFKISGVNAGERSGWSVSGAGDVNGDGFDDLIVGAPSVTNSPTNKPDEATDPTKPGKSYVVFGKASFDADLDIKDAPSDGTNGFVINGINGGDGAGFSVSSAGDINTDGFADLVVGAPFADADSLFGDAGETYVIYGGTNIGIGGSLNLDSLNGTNGFVLKGTFSDDRSGWSVSNVGDVNNDSVDDLIIGALESDGSPGKSYVVFGSQTTYSGTADFTPNAGELAMLDRLPLISSIGTEVVI